MKISKRVFQIVIFLICATIFQLSFSQTSTEKFRYIEDRKIGNKTMKELLENHAVWLDKIIKNKGDFKSINPSDLKAKDPEGRISLEGVNLNKTGLSRADLRLANLQRAQFKGSILYKTNFIKSNLAGADFQEADISEAYFQEANLQGADLRRIDIREANFRGADLRGVTGLDVFRCREARTMYQAKLDPELLKEIQENYPHIIMEPKGTPE